MNSYFVTLVFLTLMGMLTSSEVVRFSQKSLGSHFFALQQEKMALFDELAAYGALDDFRLDKKNEVEDEIIQNEKPKRSPSKKNSLRRSASLKFNLSRPPNNSRLNLYPLLHNALGKNESGKKELFNRYETAARLMRSLYQGTYFFFANAEYQILDKLIQLKDQTTSFQFPDELSSLDFQDPSLQNVLYLMLKGAEGRPSLLNYVTFDNPANITPAQKKINLLFASPTLIHALFENSLLADHVLSIRDAQWEEIFFQEAHRLQSTADKDKKRRDFKKELRKNICSLFLDSRIPKKNLDLFDYSLGKYGNILFVEDEQTGFVYREKHLSNR